jgi:hypothetical protein
VRLAALHITLAEVHFRKRDYKRAEDELTNALAIWSLTHTKSPFIGPALAMRADVRARQGRAESLGDANEGIRLVREQWPGKHPMTLFALNSYSQVMHRFGRKSAARMADEEIAVLRQVVRQSSDRLVVSVSDLNRSSHR